MQIRCSNCFFEYEEEFGMCPNCGYVEGEDYSEAYSLKPGTQIKDSRYIMGEVLGLGGFGITYKAWDRQLETVVAIKEYFPSGLVNRTADNASVFLVASKREKDFVYGKQRFLDEARNMAKFSNHHNIVNVFNYFEENNTAYIIMEYLDGMTLSQTLQMQQEPLPVDRCVSIAIDICDALESIHKEKILHRDVSPDNIMLCKDGTVKLFDFGAARFSMDAVDESNVTVIVKPGFAPPEQYNKVNQQNASTDLYALAATMYYALTGVRPEESTDRQIKDTLRPPTELVSGVPEYVNNAILRAMAVESQYRFPDAAAFRRVLQQRIGVNNVEQERKKRAKRRWIGIGAALLAVLVAAAGVWLLWQGGTGKVDLPEGHIEIWYMTSGEETADQQEAKTFQAVTERFMEEYEKVSVSVVGIPQELYEQTLAEAAKKNTLPDIYESTGLTPEKLPGAQTLEELLKSVSNDIYVAALGENTVQYPTGLILPVIYVNTSVGVVSETQDLEKIAAVCQDYGSTLLMAENAIPLYQNLYGVDAGKYGAKDAKAQFLTGKSLVYLGTTADYLDVQEGLMGKGIGTYSAMLPQVEQAAYSYGCLWSSTAQDGNSEKISQAMLAYLNSDFAQDYLNIRNFEQSDCVPATRTAVTAYLKSYVELVEIGTYLEKSVICEPQ